MYTHNTKKQIPYSNSDGMLIAIEGIDGAGKSSLARYLHDLLQEQFPVILTKEPGGSLLGAYLRTLIHDQKIPLASKTEFLLFAADRAQHMAETVLPALRENKIVISDRMTDSSLVYQGYGRGISLDMIYRINEWIMEGRRADITFYLKISPDLAQERLKKRGQNLSVFEANTDFVEKVRQGFEHLFANRTDVIPLDASQDMHTVEQQAVEALYLWIDRYLSTPHTSSLDALK